MIRTSHILSLAVIGTALFTAGCGGSDKPSNAATSATKPAPASTAKVTTPTTTTTPTPAATPSTTTTSKTPAEVKPLGNTTAPATATGQASADLTQIVESLPPVPTQDEVDAAAQKSISDANADAEFEKLSKEIESDKP